MSIRRIEVIEEVLERLDLADAHGGIDPGLWASRIDTALRAHSQIEEITSYIPDLSKFGVFPRWRLDHPHGTYEEYRDWFHAKELLEEETEWD